MGPWILVMCMYGTNCAYMSEPMSTRIQCEEVAQAAIAVFPREEIKMKQVVYMCVPQWNPAPSSTSVPQTGDVERPPPIINHHRSFTWPPS